MTAEKKPKIGGRMTFKLLVKEFLVLKIALDNYIIRLMKNNISFKILFIYKK